MFRKRILLILALLVFCFAGQALLRAGDSSAEPEQPKPDLESPKWSFDDLDFDRVKSPAQSELLGKFALAIGFVVLLGVCAWYVSKKFGGKFAGLKGKDISIVETVHLGSGKSLHLLEVGDNQKLLIGSTNENISILADVTESVSSRAEEEILP
ncbi:MAG: FliO/MopB family protein [Planctomycetota bacterium]|jgi:flagellar biogenesis protein FliO